MGKQAQKRRQKLTEEEQQRRLEIDRLRQHKQPWLRFWARADFWIYVVCAVLLVAFPFIRPQLARMKGEEYVTGKSAIIHTSMGDVTVALYQKDAPKTVENFTKLARKGYYNNQTWHRVIKDFVIQGGDPNGDGTGGESIWGKPFEDEINPRSLGVAEDKIKEYEGEGYKYNYSLTSHKMEAGSLAMANSGPNTNGSQFFIVTENPQPHLDGKHTVFGTVKKGMDVVKKIAAVAVGEGDKPVEPVYIQSVEIK